MFQGSPPPSKNSTDLVNIIVIVIHSGKRVIVDCPSSVNITPSAGSFLAGDNLTCLSDGHPQPSYQWTDTDGAVASTANTTTLTGGWFNLTCTASGNITTPCNASDTVIGFALGKYRKNKMILLIKMILVICWILHRPLTIHRQSGLLGGVVVRASDLRSSGRGFDSRPGRYRAT